MEMVRTILPQISLMVLVVVIAIGFVKKINICLLYTSDAADD